MSKTSDYMNIVFYRLNAQQKERPIRLLNPDCYRVTAQTQNR